jgi:uracil-DNA glycosylase
MASFDPGPTPAVAKLFGQLPTYAPFKDSFWFDWGPVFYRGRLNRSARLLCIASDPGPTERIANRTLVGDAGQRVQGFLKKLGLTRSYVCLNAFAYAMIPTQAATAGPLLTDPAHTKWRNDLFALVTGPKLQAVVAFGKEAQTALSLWPGQGGVPTFKVPHPSSHDEAALLAAWKTAITALRSVVTPDSKALATAPNYGATFVERDYATIPAADLPFGVAPHLGNDAWVRKATPAHPSSVTRPQPDDRHTLIWKAPVL